MKILKACCSSRLKTANLAAILLALFSAMTRAALADGEVLSTNVQAQMQALQQMKASFTAAEQKMDSQLIFAYKQSQNIPIANGAVPQLRILAQPDANGMIKVDIRAAVTPGLLKLIIKSGASNVVSYASLGSVRALVPVGQLEAVAALPGVQAMRLAVKPDRSLSDPEGVIAHRDDTAQSTFHVDGTGVKVGVMSDSVDFLAQAQSLGALGAVTVLPGQSGVPGSGEGTAMLEIVHAMAPGAQLFFATGFGGQANFASNIRQLRFVYGCDIIVDDVTYADESPFQDGVIAQAVNDVTDSGGLYFSSAANSGNLDSGTSGTWEGDFVNGGAVGAPLTGGKGGVIHSFGTITYDAISQPSNEGAPTALFWSDPLGASTNDYDLYVLDATGANIVSSSVSVQNGTQDPFEIVPAPNTGERLVVVLASGTNRFLHIDTDRAQLAIGTQGSTRGHNAATNAFTVAAIDVATAQGSFFTGGAANPVEFFSSDGPRHMFYFANGSAITPGDFSITGGVIVQKPDLAAANGVTTTLPPNSGLNPFFGTSAAAPHAAGIAALVKSFNPNLTEAQVRTVLTNTALDDMALGVDRDTGAGIAMSFQALQATPFPVPAPKLLVETNVISSGNGNGLIDPNECNSLDIVLTNAGSAPATTVQATLSSITPGVTIAAPTAFYPNIPVGATVTNTTSFRVSTSPVFVCGSTVTFTLVTKSDQNTATNVFTVTTGTPGVPIRFDSTTVVPIPDNNPAGTNSIIVVSNLAAAVQHVTVSLNIIHPFVSDLALQLIAPDGTAIFLAQNVGGSGQDFGIDCTDPDRTTFDDNASSSIVNGTAPFIGTFQPMQQLASFTGKSGQALNGPWQLQMVDDAPIDVGFLQCWSLTITPSACTDGGGQCPGVDLALGMVAAPNPVTVQSNLTYTISVTNNGPDTAKNVSINQSLPNSVLFVSGTTSQGTVTFGGGTVSCNVGTLVVGQVATVSVVVVPQTAGTIFSTATAGAQEQDLNPFNNTVTVSTVVKQPSADLGVTLVANPNPVLLNGLLTYTATVINNGASTATNVVVSNTLPANVSFASASASQGSTFNSANIVIANLGNLAVGSNAAVTIQVHPLVLGVITAKSVVSSDVADLVPANNTATVNVNVTAASDLSLLLAAPPSAVVGSNVTYQITVQNGGPSVATGVSVKDTLPAGVSLVSATSPQGPCSFAGGVVTCTITNVPVNASATVTIVVGTASFLGQTNVILADTASVTAAQGDPTPLNDTASISTLLTTPILNVVPAGFLLQAESFVPTNGMIDPLEQVTMLLKLQNIGNIDSANNLSATLLSSNGVIPVGSAVKTYGILAAGSAPVGQTFTFVNTSTNGGSITASLALSNAGTNLGVVHFTFVLPNTNGFASTNTIIIPDHGPAQPSPSTNVVSGITNVIGKVTLTVTNFNHTFPDDVDMLLVGPHGQNVLLMSHSGDSVAVSNLSLTFDDGATNSDGTRAYLPPDRQILPGSYVPSQYGSVNFTNTFGGTVVISTNNPPPSQPYGTNLSVFNGTLANGAWLLYVFDESPSDQGKIIGGWSLNISSGTEVNPVVDLAVTGKATPTNALAGGALTYTFTITNNGPNPASVVSFTNILPANATFISATNSLHTAVTTNGNGAVYCVLTNLTSGSNVTVTVVVVPNVPGLVSSQASVTGSDSDPNQSNNSTTVNTTVTAPLTDLAVTMVGFTNAVVGSNATFVIGVTNIGTNLALGVVVTDPLGQLSFSSGTSTGPNNPFATNGAAVCNLGNLAAGAGASVTLFLSSALPITVTNTATATTASTDTNSANNSASAVTTFNFPAPNIVAAGARLIAGPANGTIAPGQTVTVALQLANIGTADTSNLTATLLAGNGVVSPSGAQSYGVLLHGGPATANNFSFTASGGNGGVIVATLQLSDRGTNLPPVTYSFNLPATNTYANTNGIVIPDHGPATPYPSVIAISGVTGLVNKATVTLTGFSHQFPNDVEVLLVDPAGQSVMLMSGVGGGHATTNVTLTFDDAAAAGLPSSSLFALGTGQIVSGTFLATDDGQAQSLPSPAPATPSGSALSKFIGSNPNGAWTLYVLDTSAGDAGSIANWSLNLATINPVNSASDLTIGLAKSVGSLYPGAQIVFTVSVTNKGPADAANVTVTDTFPAGLNFAGTSLGSSSVGAGGAIVFNLGSLASGSNTTFTVTGTATQTGSFVNGVSVTADQTDLNPADNTAQAGFQVAPLPKLSASAGSVNGAFALTLSVNGPLGTYNIFTTTNLTTNFNNWTLIGTVTNLLGTVQFTDTNAANLPAGYYRAVLAP